MKRFAHLFILFSLCFLYSCNNSNSSTNGESPVGLWIEYREDGDNYLTSSWKFNIDGSGIFVVDGISENQRMAFTWKKVNSSEIEINANGDTQLLEIKNGLLIENGAFGTTVFKKQ